MQYVPQIIGLGLAAAIILIGIAAGVPQSAALVISAVATPVLYLVGLFAASKIKGRRQRVEASGDESKFS